MFRAVSKALAILFFTVPFSLPAEPLFSTEPDLRTDHAAIFSIADSGTSPTSSATTVFSLYSDSACASLITSSTITGVYTFYKNTTVYANAVGAYNTALTFTATPEQAQSAQSIRIQPRSGGVNIFNAPQPCFAVSYSSGSYVYSGAAASVTFRF